ncbi:Hypp1460 [Branchiostoma lanceolatum]|uniref:Hypp1460 protein n=1 Tax=Branchiostoma lanceolatum TaxID=7740 RepID=A0A8J9ZKX2_BRALA|nr:Hypp1460 [Branchiostoma lanceolatum]
MMGVDPLTSPSNGCQQGPNTEEVAPEIVTGFSHFQGFLRFWTITRKILQDFVNVENVSTTGNLQNFCIDCAGGRRDDLSQRYGPNFSGIHKGETRSAFRARNSSGGQ